MNIRTVDRIVPVQEQPTHGRMNKPNFLVIGAQKSGTTSLCSLLGQHFEIFMSERKEPHFFAKDALYARGWDWYASLFEDAADAKAIGEGSTGYTLHTEFPSAPTRIARDLPQAKLLYIVRDPLERMESAWMQRKGDGRPVWSLGKTLRRYHSMVDGSRYWKQLSYYRQYYPDDQILILFFEDFKKNPSAVLRSCFEFLGVDPNVRIQGLERVENASHGKLAASSLSVWARHHPRIRQFGRLFPTSWRQAVRNFGRREISQRPKWDAATLEWVLYEVASDTAKFLRFAGKPGDFWDLGFHRADNR